MNFNLKLLQHLDFETRSELELPVVGAWKYALHPSTQITCMTFGSSKENLTTYNGLDIRFDWSKVQIPDWDKLLIMAHSADFEYAVANLILHRRHGWPERWAPSLWRCTLAKAAASGLPLGLDPLGRILQIKTPKDLEGRATMLQLSRPLYVDPLFGATYDETPSKYAKLCSYNRTDVCAEMEVDAGTPDLSPSEQMIWEHYLAVNRRGITIDTTFAAKASSLAIPLVDGLNERLHAITCTAPKPCTKMSCNGVDKASRVAALKKFLSARFSINVSSLDKEGVTDLLEDPNLDPMAREVLTIRRQVGKKNSVAKYDAAAECVSPDGRARGLIQYHGAHTGRTSGRLLQPHNMPKGFKEKAQRKAIDAVMTLDARAFLDTYGDQSMDTLSNTSRGMFLAAPGKQLVCADFNAIEARVLFWEAGEQDALDAYSRGESPYVDMARYIYNNPTIVKPTDDDKTWEVEYDIGKRTILGCGYQMGWKRFQSNIYTETAKVGKPVWIEDALAQRAVKAYREKYRRVKGLWYDTEAAAVNAVRSPGQIFTCGYAGRIAWAMSVDRRFLLCRLPSGRYLRYWQPRVVGAWRTWCDDVECPHMVYEQTTGFDGTDKCPKKTWKESLCFMGEHEDTKQWVPLATYGGALVENYTQAVARDLMVNGMLQVQAKGYDVLLDVYDEVLSEHPAPDLKEYIALMCNKPPWAATCPVAAEGWIGERYHK